ncbi:MAG: PAS domain S-box protein [Bacteroidota bacterium]
MKEENISGPGNLRQKAEKILNSKPKVSDGQLSVKEALKLIHELEVHQIELEMQNKDLAEAKTTAQESAEKYAALYDFAPVGYLTLSNDAEILEINLCASQMIGRDRSLVKKSTFGFFVSDGSKPVFNRFLEKLFAGKAKETCEVILTPAGKAPIYVHLCGIASRDGEQCLLTLVDFSRMKEFEHELQQSEERFRHVSSTISDISYSCKVNEKGEYAIDWIFGASEQITGYTTSEIMAMGCWGKLVEDEDAGSFQKNVNGLSAGSSANCELRLRHRDGRIVWIASSAECVAIQDDKGPFVIYGAMVDITKRKLAEEELNATIDELQRFHRLTVGREVTMIELKKEVNELLREAGKDERYRIVG